MAKLRQWFPRYRVGLTVSFVAFMHLTGALSPVQAVMSTRTPRGAVAWATSLNTFTSVAVLAYWIFGKSKFDGNETLRQREVFGKSAVTHFNDVALLVD